MPTVPAGSLVQSGLAKVAVTVFERRRQLMVPVIVVAIVMALIFAIRYRIRTPHQPSPEAQRWYDLGVAALGEGLNYKASKVLLRATETDDQFALAHARLAEAWSELDYSDKAKDEIIRAGLLANHSALSAAESLRLQALTQTLSGDLGGAITSFESIVDQSPTPDAVAAYIDLGRAFTRAEQIDQAVVAYTRALQMDQNSAAALLNSGLLYARKRDLTNAYASFDKAEKLYNDTSNYEGVAEVLYQRALRAESHSTAN